MTPEEQAREIVKQFDYRSDCDMSLADRQWLTANISAAIQGLTSERDEALGHAAAMSNDLTHLGERLGMLEQALHSLCNEVSGMLSLERTSIREAIGVTNLGVLELRLAEGCQALASTAYHIVDANKMV